jgi:hypothetical protein
MRMRRRFLFWRCGSLILLATLLAMSACAAAGTRSTAGTPTAVPTDTPAGPMTYSAGDFSITYPGDLVAVPGEPPTGEQGTRVSIMIPDQGNGHEILQILETYPTAQATLQSLCAWLAGMGSPTTLAGLPMYYRTIVGGTVRHWTYVDSNKNTYDLWADDLGQGTTAQDRQRDDQILATFKVKDTTPGC